MAEPNREAEEQKELGNKAFSAKEYEKAIEYYTAAIQIDDKNHVYFSNRSACNASLKQWEASATDAEQCIKISPAFIKGYYRLTTAQLELELLDDALATVKKGLTQDVNNPQLLKLQRTIKQRKVTARRDAAAAKKQSKQANNQGPKAGANPLSATANKEVMELQQQFIVTNREYNMMKANLAKTQREQKVNSITLSELEKLSDEETKKTKMYRGIGKMFMLSDQDNVMGYLKDGMESEKRRELEITSKMEYLERRMKSQQNNIQELIRGN